MRLSTSFSVHAMYKPPAAVGPEIHQIRIIHKKPEKTKNVEVLWWDRAKPKIPSIGTVYIDAPKPDFEARHAVLGRFIDTWSKLEQQLREKVRQRIGNNTVEATTISYSQSGRDLVNLLINLSEPYLIPSKNREYVNLSERFSRAGTTRNRLIHGNWSVEYIVEIKNETPMANVQIVREYPPLSPSGKHALNKLNSPERQKFIWTLDDIENRRREIEQLMEAYHLFHKANLPWPPKVRG